MKYYIKQILYISAIIGGVLGIFSLIPYFMCLGSLIFCIISVITIIFLKRNGYAGVISLNDGTVIGAISGFIGAAAACLVYMPLAFIGAIIFKQPLLFKFNDLIFIVPITIVVFGMLGAIMNAFCGMVTAYLYEKLEKDRPEEEQVDFIIDEE